MKNVILLMGLLSSFNLFSQSRLVYENEGVFDYALIENDKFYFSERPTVLNKSAIVKMKRLDANSIVVKHYTSDPWFTHLPFVWSKDSVNLFSVAIWASNASINSHIYYRNFESLDSVQVANLNSNEVIKKSKLSITPFRSYIKSFDALRNRPDSEDIYIYI